MSARGPRIGDIVTYTLSDTDAQQINARRRTAAQLQEAILEDAWAVGAQAHMGTSVASGDVCAAVLVRVTCDDVINAQVLLDGTDVHWVRAVHRDDAGARGTWRPSPPSSTDLHHEAERAR